MTDVFVDSDAMAAMAVSADGGVVLPVSVGSIEFAKSSEWSDYVLGRTFNAVFYAALKSVGVGQDQVNLDIRALMAHRLAFGMTAMQVRMAYGVEKGIVGRNYRFKPSVVDGSDWEARLTEDRERKGDHPGKGVGCRFDGREWDRIETDALAACVGLPDQVDIAVEFRWIRCNLHQSPYFKDAPSRGAIMDWLTCMKPGGVDPLLRDFTNLAWSKRLSPGEKKPKASAFSEDRSASVEVERDEALERRLSDRLGEV